jgi:hypothetical protein
VVWGGEVRNFPLPDCAGVEMKNIDLIQDRVNKCVSTGQCVLLGITGDYDELVKGVDLKGCRLERKGQTLVYVWLGKLGN